MTPKRVREHVAKLVRFAEENGVGVSFEKTRKHQRVILSRGGDSCFLVIPSSPSDGHHGPQQAFKDGKHLMQSKGWIE